MHAPCAGLRLLNWLTSRSLLFVRFEGEWKQSGIDGLGAVGQSGWICTGRVCVREHSQVPNSLLRSHFWPALLCAAHSVVMCTDGLVL